MADLELVGELKAALDGDLDRWRTALREAPWADPFRAMRAEPAIEAELAKAAGCSDLKDWLTAAHSWIDTMNRPGRVPSPLESVLRTSWEFFRDNLGRALARARGPGGLPASGGVLAFVDALDLCLVVDYRFPRNLPELHVIEAIETPRTVFDVLDTLLQRPHETRTALKRMLQSSHRLVWHRNVLVHVDRREEPSVFGPSIDTLHLAELVTCRFAGVAQNEQPKRVLEVGTGSGLLSAAVLRNLGGMERLTGIEIDPSAANCTYRNWIINSADRAGLLREKGALIVAPFNRDLLKTYDLVICNPPYIPRHPGEARAARDEGRSVAVAGLELLNELVQAAPDLVKPGGSFLLVVSSVTPPESVAAPDGFAIEWPWGDEGMGVLFEVEEVFATPPWLKQLQEAGGLSMSGDYYEHRLHAAWLTRTEGT